MNGDDAPRVLEAYDARDPKDYPYRGWPPLMDWIRDHGADPVDVIRLQVLVIDGPLVRFTEVIRGWHGGLSGVKDRTGHLVLETQRRDVLLRRMPPERAGRWLSA